MDVRRTIHTADGDAPWDSVNEVFSGFVAGNKGNEFTRIA
jgi:hypothetical protein